MMNKKGFELSATVIVLLVITIVIFMGSLYFLKQFYSGAQEIKGEIERSTQEQIESLLRSGDLVAIPLNKKTVKKGNGAVFGLGIRNIGADKEFSVVVDFYRAFQVDGRTEVPVDPFYIEDNWLLYSEGPYFLDSNELRIVPVSVTVGHAIDDLGTSTQTGTYIFNACVFKEGAMMDCDLDAFKSAGFPDELYSKKVYQILVEVP